MELYNELYIQMTLKIYDEKCYSNVKKLTERKMLSLFRLLSSNSVSVMSQSQ